MYIYFIFNIQTYIKHLHSNYNTKKHEMIGDPNLDWIRVNLSRITRRRQGGVSGQQWNHRM